MPKEKVSLEDRLKQQEQTLKQLSTVESVNFDDIKTKEDILRILAKTEMECEILSSFEQRFTEFKTDADKSILKTIAQGRQSQLKPKDKIDIPINGEMFPWKEDELKKKLQEFEEWRYSKADDNEKEKLKKKPLYEFTKKGDLRMTAENSLFFLNFLYDKDPLETYKFLIYANYGMGKKAEHNVFVKKVRQYLSIALTVLLSVVSVVLYVVSGGLSSSFKFLKPLKSLGKINKETRAIDFTKKGKAVCKARNYLLYASAGAAFATTGLRFLSNGIDGGILDKDLDREKAKKYSDFIAKKKQELLAKINNIKNKTAELATKGVKMSAEINDKVKNLTDILQKQQNKSTELQEELKKEQEKNKELEQRQNNQFSQQYPQNYYNPNQYQQPIQGSMSYYPQPQAYQHMQRQNVLQNPQYNNNNMQPNYPQPNYPPQSPQNMYNQFQPNMINNQQQPNNLNDINKKQQVVNSNQQNQPPQDLQKPPQDLQKIIPKNDKIKEKLETKKENTKGGPESNIEKDLKKAKIVLKEDENKLYDGYNPKEPNNKNSDTNKSVLNDTKSSSMIKA